MSDKGYWNSCKCWLLFRIHEYVPMVDKAVDSGWNKQPSPPKLSISVDLLPSSDSRNSTEGLQARILAAFMAFMTFFLIFRSSSSRITKKLPDASSQHERSLQEFSFNSGPKEEFRPPSPAQSFTEAELLSSVVKRLGELEEKVNIIESKPCEMPCEKEELLNAAVYRVDAVEAELIATKKGLSFSATLFSVSTPPLSAFRAHSFLLKINYDSDLLRSAY